MKNLPRFFISNSQTTNKNFVIEDKEVINKIRNVLRLATNDRVELITENNMSQGEIIEISKSRVTGRIISSERIEEDNKPRIILAQALPKGSKLDEIVKNNTQIGVSEFVFFESDFSIVKAKDFREKKIDRLKKIALSSCEQSERLSVPVINLPIKFEEMLNYEANLKLFLHSRETKNSINIKGVGSFRLDRNPTEEEDTHDSKPKTHYSQLITVGPEGGFSDSEVERAKEAGFEIAHMDLPILRTELAGVIACSYSLI